MIKWIGIIGLVFLFTALVQAFKPAPNIGLIEIRDVISDSKPALDRIRDYKDNDQIKAVLVRIDSPGGMVAPTQEIYAALRDLDTLKPVIASLGSVAASGGYYIACAAREIISNPGTITGSIGVIMPHMNVGGLLKRLSIESSAITSGPLKGINMPYRAMRTDERAHLQGIVDDLYSQFKQDVANGRDLPMEKVIAVAHGGIFTGQQALKLELVDALGNFDVALDRTTELAGLGDAEPIIDYPIRPSVFERFMNEGQAYSMWAKNQPLFVRP